MVVITVKMLLSVTHALSLFSFKEDLVSVDVVLDSIKLDLSVLLVLQDVPSARLHSSVLFAKTEDLPSTVNVIPIVLPVLLLSEPTLLVLPATLHAQHVLNIHQNVCHVNPTVDICSTLSALSHAQWELTKPMVLASIAHSTVKLVWEAISLVLHVPKVKCCTMVIVMIDAHT